MLVASVSFEGRLDQYVGRLNRDYEGKETVFVYDYIDSHIRYFDNMYAKRLRTYRKTGFTLWTDEEATKQIANAIYDTGNYVEVVEQALVEAEKKIIISSPEIILDKIERLIFLVKSRQEAGACIAVIITVPENVSYGSPDVCNELVEQ